MATSASCSQASQKQPPDRAGSWCCALSHPKHAGVLPTLANGALTHLHNLHVSGCWSSEASIFSFSLAHLDSVGSYDTVQHAAVSCTYLWFLAGKGLPVLSPYPLHELHALQGAGVVQLRADVLQSPRCSTQRSRVNAANRSQQQHASKTGDTTYQDRN